MDTNKTASVDVLEVWDCELVDWIDIRKQFVRKLELNATTVQLKSVLAIRPRKRSISRITQDKESTLSTFLLLS